MKKRTCVLGYRKADQRAAKVAAQALRDGYPEIAMQIGDAIRANVRKRQEAILARTAA